MGSRPPPRWAGRSRPHAQTAYAGWGRRHATLRQPVAKSRVRPATRELGEPSTLLPSFLLPQRPARMRFAASLAAAPPAVLVTVGVCEFSAAPSLPNSSGGSVRARPRHVGRDSLAAAGRRVSPEKGAAATARPTSAPRGGRAGKNGEMGVVGAGPEAMGHAGGAVVGAP